MPFKSLAQERWMFATHPRMAARWAKETPKGKKLPIKKSIYSGAERADTSPNLGRVLYANGKPIDNLKRMPRSPGRNKMVVNGRNFKIMDLVPQYRPDSRGIEVASWGTMPYFKNTKSFINEVARNRHLTLKEATENHPQAKLIHNKNLANLAMRHKQWRRTTTLKGAAVTAAIGGVGYEAHKVKKDNFVSKNIPSHAIHQGKRVRVLHQHSKDFFAILHPVHGQHVVHRNQLTFLSDAKKVEPVEPKWEQGKLFKALVPIKSTKPLLPKAPIAGASANNPLKLKTTGRVSGHMNMTGINRPKTPGTYVAKGYDFTMTQSRFGGSSAVGKAYVEPVSKGVASLYRSGAGASAKRVAQATQASTREWSASARADMRRRADQAMSGSKGKELVLRNSRGVRVEKPASTTRPAAVRSGRNPGTDVVLRQKGSVAPVRRAPEYVKSTPLSAVGGRSEFLGMPGRRIPDAKPAKVKKPKVAETSRSYAPEATAAALAGGGLGYAGYKSVNKAVDEFGNQIPSSSNGSNALVAGGAVAGGLGAKKFGEARMAPVRLPAEAAQAKRNAKFTASNFDTARAELTAARANKTRFKGGQAVKRAENKLRVTQNRMDISASQAKRAKKATKTIGLAQRDLRWKGAGLLAGGAGLAGMGAAMKEKNQ